LEKKKPLYKRWWFWLIVILVIGAVATAGSGDDSSDEPKKVGENQQEQKKDEGESSGTGEESENSEPEKADDGRIEEGTYKIGTDIPAGEYIVFAGSMAYVECAKDSSGQLDSIIFNDNLPSGSHLYVTLNNGEYFKMQFAYMYPVDKAPSVKPADGVYKDGMYKVGKDIPAGEYKVKVTDPSGMGYFEVSKDSRHVLDSIVTNENVQSDTYLTVSNGQYLLLRGVTIEK